MDAFNFCEKPIFTEKKKDKLLLSVAGFFFYVFAFMQIIWRVDTAGGIQRVEAVHLEIQLCGP